MGSPSAYEQICADLELEPGQFELTLRKEILWESETATDAEVRAKEKDKILETGANNPAIGYNMSPRWKGSTAVGRPPKPTMKRLITRWHQIEDSGHSCQWQADTPVGAFRVVAHQWDVAIDGYRVIPPGEDFPDPKFTSPTLDAARAVIRAEVRTALESE
jgi:hypothetical protein